MTRLHIALFTGIVTATFSSQLFSQYDRCMGKFSEKGFSLEFLWYGLIYHNEMLLMKVEHEVKLVRTEVRV